MASSLRLLGFDTEHSVRSRRSSLLLGNNGGAFFCRWRRCEGTFSDTNLIRVAGSLEAVPKKFLNGSKLSRICGWRRRTTRGRVSLGPKRVWLYGGPQCGDRVPLGQR